MESPVPSAVVRPAISLGKMLWRKLFPPKVGYTMAPSNLLEVISPGTCRAKVEEILGAPHCDTRGGAAYRFANALLQLEYADDAVELVCLATLRTRWPNRFDVFPLGLKLGVVTFKDLFNAHPKDPTHLFIDNSSKFFVHWRSYYFGHPGRYFHFAFGSIAAATYPALDVPEVDSNTLNDGSNRQPRTAALSKPEEVRCNVVCIGRTEHETFPFSWQLFT